MLEIGLAAIMAAALAVAAPSAGTERIVAQNGIEIVTDLATGITPRICDNKAERFRSAQPDAARMNPATRAAFLESRRGRCVRELKDYFGIISEI